MWGHPSSFHRKKNFSDPIRTVATAPVPIGPVLEMSACHLDYVIKMAGRHLCQSSYLFISFQNIYGYIGFACVVFELQLGNGTGEKKKKIPLNSQENPRAGRRIRLSSTEGVSNELILMRAFKIYRGL